jgi:hypothetical protein
LELELTEKTWAVSRAVELSDAVARLEEDNTRLTRELAAANVTLLGQKRRIDELENTVIDAIAFQERVATTGRACLRCLETEETKHRRDVAEGERAQRYALECEWHTYTNTWKFASVQCIETEIELMWREDQLAHAAALRDAQRRVDEVDVVAAELSTALRDVETWKVKYRDLKEKGRAHIEDLRAVHEENLKRARATYLRCNPNQATLFWALEHLERISCERFKQVLELSKMQKALRFMSQELLAMRAFVFTKLAGLSKDVLSALRVCTPVLWQATPAAPAQSPTQLSPHKQQGHHYAAALTDRYRPSSRPRSASTDSQRVPRSRDTSPHTAGGESASASRSNSARRTKTPGAESRAPLQHPLVQHAPASQMRSRDPSPVILLRSGRTALSADKRLAAGTLTGAGRRSGGGDAAPSTAAARGTKVTIGSPPRPSQRPLM